jgi:pseudouridine-5'-phosphate glycosidase
MQRQGVTGKDTTPFLLARIAEQTGGRSLTANIALVKNNAKVAAEIAKSFAAL